MTSAATTWDATAGTAGTVGAARPAGTIGAAGTVGTTGTTGTAVTSLTALRRGATARVTGLDAALGPAVSRRLADLGFVADADVECVRRAPLGSPTIYRIGETQLCLRRSLSDGVLITGAL